MKAEIIDIKPPAKWWVHSCTCSTFYLRDDGVIICEKCFKRVGTWQQK